MIIKISDCSKPNTQDLFLATAVNDYYFLYGEHEPEQGIFCFYLILNFVSVFWSAQSERWQSDTVLISLLPFLWHNVKW